MKNTLIIVEGPDCSGKTTLAKALAHHLGSAYMHLTCTKALAGAMRDYQLHVMRDVAFNVKEGPGVVLDRSWISEAVYAPILRPAAESPMTEIKAITEGLIPFYVFCDRTDVEEAHAANKDKAHPYPRRQFRKIVSGYHDIYEEMKGDFFIGPRVMRWAFDSDRELFFSDLRARVSGTSTSCP